MPHLAITLLGPFGVTLDSHPLSAFKSHKCRALLAYLAALPDRPHPRTLLADLLWPQRTEREALRLLSYALADLRRTLGEREAEAPLLRIDRDGLQLPRSEGVWVDALEMADAAHPDRSPPPEALRRALDLYRGPFLEGFPTASAPFEEWLAVERERYARLALTALHRLGEHHAGRGEWEEAARYARRALAMEPWDEGAHRALMRSLARAGQRGAALEHYDACRRSLTEGLGVDPDPETQALFRLILEGVPAQPLPEAIHNPAAALPPPADQEVHSVPFVGRTAELAQLQGAVREALLGRGRVVWVRGEAGSGKTWLLQEAARRAVAEHPDLLVAVGRCDAYVGIGDPYLPFVHVLRALYSDLSDQWPEGVLPVQHAGRLRALLPVAVEALLTEGHEILGRLISGEALLARSRASLSEQRSLLERLERAVDRQAQDVPLEQSHLFESCARTLRSLALDHPLLLILDDLQWADVGSLSLLFHLGRRLAGSRLLVVSAYRAEVLADPQTRAGHHALAEVIREFCPARGTSSVDLDAADGHAFVQALLDIQPNRLDETFRSTLLRHTGGHPLFTVELLRGLQDRGDLHQDASGRWVASETVDWEHLPGNVEGVIAERVQALPAMDRQVLEAASVEGEEFTAEALAEVSETPVGEVLRALGSPPLRDRHVVAEGLVRVGEQRLSRYRFRHALYQAFLYGSLDPGRRAFLHEGVGRALQGLYGASAGGIAPALARHYEEAGRISDAVIHLEEAAQRASRRMAAPTEAEAYCRRGLRLLEGEPDTAGWAAHRVRLLMVQSTAIEWQKEPMAPEMLPPLKKAEALCRRHGMDRELSWVLGTESPAVSRSQALALAEEALEVATHTGLPLYMAYAHYRVGAALWMLGGFGGALEHVQRAQALLDSPGLQGDILMAPDYLAILCLAEESWLQALLGYPDRALACAERALSLAEETGWQYVIGRVRDSAWAVRMERGEWREAQALARLLATSRMELHSSLVDYGSYQMYDTWAAILAGDPDASADSVLDFYDQTYRHARRRHRPNLGPVLAAGHVCVLLGIPQQGLAIAEEGLRFAAETDTHWMDTRFHWVRAECLLRGDEDESAAESAYCQALSVARKQEARLDEIRVAIPLARLWQSQGRREEALALLAPLYEWFTEGFDTVHLRDARALLEQLGNVPGRHDPPPPPPEGSP